jgi:hypothetical protein
MTRGVRRRGVYIGASRSENAGEIGTWHSSVAQKSPRGKGARDGARRGEKGRGDGTRISRRRPPGPGGPARRHTTLCLFRRRRPLALRPPSAALSLLSSAITAWCARSLMPLAVIIPFSQLPTSVVRRRVPSSTSSGLACPSSVSTRASLPCSRMGGANSSDLLASSPFTFFIHVFTPASCPPLLLALHVSPAC